MAIERSIRINVEAGRAKAELRSLQGSLQSADKVTGALRNSLAGLVAGFSFGQAINQITRFEDEMAGVRAVTGATTKEFEQLNKQARLLGATTTFGAEQAAGAQRFLAQAGFEVNEILSATPGILNLAKAGNLELAEAADIASNVLSGLRLEVSELTRVNDVLVKSANSANTNVRQLGEAFAFAAPFAAAAGVSLEETAAFIGTVSDAGIQASRAGTDFVGFIRQTAKVLPEAQKALAAYGLSAKDVDVSTRGLIPVLQTLEKAGLSLSDAFTIFGTEAGDSAQIVINAASKVQRLTTEFDNAAGSAKNAAAIMGDTLSASIKGLTSAISEAVLQAGDGGLGGALRELAVVAAGVVQSYNGLLDVFAESNNLTDNQIAVIEAATVATEALAFVVASRLVGSIAASVGETIKDVAAKIKLTTANVAARPAVTGLSAALGVQAKALTAAQLRANALTASMTALRGAMTLLGGPVGIAITAATAIGIYASSLETAEEKARKAKEETNEFVQSLQGAAIIQFTTALFNAGEEADSARSALAEAKTELERLERVGASSSKVTEELRVKISQLEASVVTADDKVRQISNTFQEAAKSAQEFGASVSGDDGLTETQKLTAEYNKLKAELDEATRITEKFNQTKATIIAKGFDEARTTELIALAEKERDEGLKRLADRARKASDQNAKLHRSFTDLRGEFEPTAKIAFEYAEIMKEIERSTASDAEKKQLQSLAYKKLQEDIDNATTTAKEFLAQFDPIAAAEVRRIDLLKQLEKVQASASEKQALAAEIQRQYNKEIDDAIPSFTELNAQFSAADAATAAYVNTLKDLDEAQRLGVDVTELRANALKAYQKAAEEARKQDRLNEETSQSFFEAFAQGIGDAAITAENQFDAIRRVGRESIQGLADQITQFITTGEADFKGFASSVITELLKIQTQALIVQGLTSIGLGGAFGLTAARGAAFDGGMQKFARGGASLPLGSFSNSVVSTPTKFAAGGTLGQMGEAGAEAILPLQRTAGGELGVNASGMVQQQPAPVNVDVPVQVINVTERPQDYLGSDAGVKQIVNIMTQNKAALQS